MSLISNVIDISLNSSNDIVLFVVIFTPILLLVFYFQSYQCGSNLKRYFHLLTYSTI